jgi:hypothetical protein
MSAPEVLARRSSFCALCKLKIHRKQDYISPLPNGRWAHATCAASYRRVLEEHREDDAA